MSSIVNITRDQARQRSEILTAAAYRVEVDLSGRGVDGNPLETPETHFVSTSTARFTSAKGDTWIDIIADQLIDAWCDGEQIDVSGFNGARLPLSLGEGEHQLTVTALCRYSRTGEGLHRFVDPADGKVYLYSQFETADARRMYACFDQPDQKATFELAVIAPAHWKVYSNSPAVAPTPGPDPFATWQFAPTKRISTYITALVAGEFHVQTGTVVSQKGELPADFVCRASMAQYLEHEQMATTTQRGFEVYEQAFGQPFPFDSYDQLFLPEYNAGAMENAGCVTLRDEYLFRAQVTADDYARRDNTILHELAHMWFGDLVTMQWWDDLWLNESFAEWSAYFCQEQIAKRHGGDDPWITFANQRKLWAYRVDQWPTTHPIAADMVDLEAVDQNFDGITYAKGASVLKQLVAYVGRDQFLAGVRNYLEAHAWGNSTFADLLDALQKASGRDLSQFATEWLETTGVNKVTPVVDVDDEGNYTSFAITQSAADNAPTLRTHRLAIGLFDVVDDILVRRDSLEVDVHGSSTPIAVLAGVKAADLVLLNDRDLSYVKVRFDPRSMDTVRRSFASLGDPLARAMIWTALWDTWRDAELPTVEYLDIVLAGMKAEFHPTAIINNLTQAHLAVTGYAPMDQRQGLRARLVAALAEFLATADPGSDRQLAIADAMIRAIDSPAGAELIEGWLAGEEVPPGLPIDADRRWAIITTLARLGRIGTPEIDAEARQDNTISGAQFAAGARSALADPITKAQAWSAATADPEIANAMHIAVAQHLWNYGQEDILAGYQDAYLKLCEEIATSSGSWASRGHIARQTALNHLWPSVLADREWIAKLDAWMATNELPAQVRQVLVQNRDNQLRAIAVREASKDD
ncbi:aminopeptidase N [Propionibacterium sp. oral taxon 192 str. F0372]|uniref:aminopeptidase N n=1 Tax=Propionibacterium sp. oral taxon 192 TaxID=671222 RepID=UPI0003537AAB|nr:aminopeptidase N [Propionibacterium sp. oral taxon 192]EPH07035.1 aminopeptidase N [Propionibacterium sp. oral taxon 192 str. F0372]